MSTLSYRPSFRITVEDQDVIIRFDQDLIDQNALGRFLDYLELESMKKRSELTEEQAATLADEIDRAVWESIKRTFVDAEA